MFNIHNTQLSLLSKMCGISEILKLLEDTREFLKMKIFFETSVLNTTTAVACKIRLGLCDLFGTKRRIYYHGIKNISANFSLL